MEANKAGIYLSLAGRRGAGGQERLPVVANT